LSVSACERVDLVRSGRALPTLLHLPAGEPPWPLVVFAHGWMGHPRKFTRLFGRWTEVGYAVAAPTFPYTNETSSGREFEDVANQPADVRFVLDRLLEDERFDGQRVALAGFSLGAATVLGSAFERLHGHSRPAAVIAISGKLPWFADCALWACPLLVVHGLHDDVVPYDGGLELYTRALPPKALLSIESPGHDAYVQDEPPTEADAVIPNVTTAFLDYVFHRSSAPRPPLDPALARLESEGIW
jgi:dienelactone hydrolase